MQLDLSTDWQVWDNTEQVVYQSTRNTGSQSDTLLVLRTPVSNAERAASAGVYVGGTVPFLLPTSQLAVGFVPKPADVLTDALGREFTVLTAVEQVRDAVTAQVWLLTTVCLEIAYELRDLINIERAEITYDEAGVKQKTFPSDVPGSGTVLYRNLPARVQLLTLETAEEREIKGFKHAYSVFVAKQISDVIFEDRVVWTQRGQLLPAYLNVVAVRNPERIDELAVIDAGVPP